MPRDVRRGHHERMQRIGFALGLASIVGGIAAPLVSVYLGLFTAVGLAGLFVAIDMVRRARVGLREDADLEVSVEDKQVTLRFDGREPHLVAPLVGGQAFPDHLQLLVGRGTALTQVELVLPPDERARFIAALSNALGAPLPERPSLPVHLLRAMTIAPAAALVLIISWRLAQLLLLQGALAALRSLDAGTALGVFAASFLVGLLALGLRHRGS